MKTTLIALVLLTLAVPAAADIPMAASIRVNPSGGSDIDRGFFFDSLSPYGNWVETPAYGWSFVPTVAPTWRPYTDGQWLYTDSGWTWLSDEPFGWATYHYGRWDLNPDYGWMWVPGDQWAPAWVDWRATDDFIGWAPLPPSFAVSPRLAFRTMDVVLPPEAYVFVPEPLFLRPQVVAFALPPGQAKKLFRSSRRFTRYRFANNLIINEGVPFVTVQRRIGRRIPRFQLVDLEPRLFRARQRARFAGNRLEVFRPRVLRTVVAVPPARPFARRSVMTVTDAVRVRRVARARAVAFNLPPPRFATRPARNRVRIVERIAARFRDFREDQDRSRRDFGRSRGIGREVSRERSRRDFGQSRGIGKDVRKQRLAPQRGVKLDSGRKEVRRQAVKPSREVRSQREVRKSSRRSTRVSSGGRSHAPRQSVRQSSRGGPRQQRAVKQDRGGRGQRAAMKKTDGGGGGRQGKRGGGRRN